MRSRPRISGTCPIALRSRGYASVKKRCNCIVRPCVWGPSHHDLLFPFENNGRLLQQGHTGREDTHLCTCRWSEPEDAVWRWRLSHVAALATWTDAGNQRKRLSLLQGPSIQKPYTSQKLFSPLISKPDLRKLEYLAPYLKFVAPRSIDSLRSSIRYTPVDTQSQGLIGHPYRYTRRTLPLNLYGPRLLPAR